MDIKTICIHGGDWKDPTGRISVPVFQSATFGHPELGQSTGYDYTRVQNPTRESTEKLVAALEHWPRLYQLFIRHGRHFHGHGTFQTGRYDHFQ